MITASPSNYSWKLNKQAKTVKIIFMKAELVNNYFTPQDLFVS